MTYAPYPDVLAAMDRHYGYNQGSATPRALRVLLATFWKYPQAGGLSKYIETLKTGLEKAGHHVDVADYQSHGDTAGETKASVEKCLIGRYGHKVEKIVNVLYKLYGYEIQLRRQWDLGSYDIFHAQDRFAANVLGRQNLYYHTPLFYTPHQLGINRSLLLKEIAQGSVEEAFFREIDKAAIRYAYKIITICNAFHEPLRGLGAFPGQLHTVYTGSDLRVPESSGQEKNKLVITSISRMTPRKGHRYLLEALSMIKEHLEGVEVLIVGDGEARHAAETLAKDLELPHVVFCGHRTDIAEILGRSDIYVHSTTSDMLPISVIEAMFGGQAIITTQVNGIPEIIRNNETGFIVDPGNAQQLAEKLILLIHDANARHALATRAQQYAQTHLRASDMAEKIAALYQSCFVSAP